VLSFLWNHLLGYERIKERADRLFLANQFEQARREYDRARSIVPDSDHRARALDALIRSCERQLAPGEAPSFALPEEALGAVELDDLFELAIADKPDSRAEAYRILGPEFREGYVALVQGRARAAAARFREAALRSPSSFLVHLELGRALSLGGELDEARDALEVALGLAPDDGEGRLLSAAISIELGRFREAESRLASLVEPGGARPEAVFLMGKALAGLGRRDDALERFRETVKLEPNFHEAFFEAGRLMKARGEVEAAFQLLNRAAALAPDEIDCNRELAELVLAHELDEEAGLVACDRLMMVDEPNRWEYLHWIGRLYLRRGWKREARDPLRKALELVPSDRGRERQVIEERLRSLDHGA
jgi:tetratricopeptide (TPR) repeat protein